MPLPVYFGDTQSFFGFHAGACNFNSLNAALVRLVKFAVLP